MRTDDVPGSLSDKLLGVECVLGGPPLILEDSETILPFVNEA
jgi:hypothetical protein